MQREFWREQLNISEKKLYDRMVSAFSHYEEEVACDNSAPEIIQKIYEFVCIDHPELYHLPYNPCIQTMMSLLGTNNTLVIKNLFSATQIRKIDQRIDSIYKELSVNFNKLKTDNEKEKYICEYLIANTNYEINNLYNQNAATVICDHKGQCSGIAKATKLLLDYSGINSIIVNGTATDTNTGVVDRHSWNIVKINGAYFHLDVTFMLGANMQKNKPYRFLYFNYSDDDMRKDHDWDGSYLPICQSSLKQMDTVEEKMKKVGIVVSSLFELRCYLKKAIIDGEHCLMVQSTIQLPKEKLVSAIKHSCGDVMSIFEQEINMSISIDGNNVMLNW